jgi:exosome complex RNA-binding protein Rrp42 (RNase PH superfamily)
MNIPWNGSTSSTRHETVSLLQCLDEKVYVDDFWRQKTRPDGRLFTQGRAIRVSFGMLKHSAGSALVSQIDGEDSSNGTKILAATTFNIGQPSPEQPDEGEVVVQVSGTGGRNVGADSKSQQQQHHWDTLQSWLQRTLKQDERMAQSLCLLTGKSCLRLVITVIVLEDNGNVKDGVLLACMAAWKDTRLPEVGKDLIENHGKLWWKEVDCSISSLGKESCVNVDGGIELVNEGTMDRDYRISLTMGIWIHPTEQKTYLLTDPSSCEEPFLEGTITIVVNLTTEKLQVEYTGKVPLTANDMALAATLARARANEVTKILSPS